MIFADKLIDLRKRSGLSQEELAEKMNVSRQSVSKWEGAQSVPDINKIIALSEIFGVSTDYLLKDELEAADFAPAEESGEELRRVTLEDANDFLEKNGRLAGSVAVGVFLCIFSIIPMIVLGVLGDIAGTDVLAGIGAAVMLCIIAGAVAIFIKNSALTEKYSFLDREPIDTVYGVEGAVRERREAFMSTFNRSIALGVVLCIIGVAAAIIMGVISEEASGFGKNGEELLSMIGVCGMMLFVAIGVFMMTKAGIRKSGFDKLLEEGDYAREKKQEQKRRSGSVNVMLIYWLLVVAVFLGVSFITDKWGWSWVIFAIGGVLSPVVSELSKLGKK